MNNSTTDADDPTPSSTLLMPVIAYPEHQAALMIWKIYPAILVVVGGFGNIASVCVMRRMKDQNSSQYAIFMALAISDLILLCTTAAYRWIKFTFHTDILLLHPALLVIVKWLVYVTSVISAWLVTFVTVQRTIAVLWPHRMRVMCTVRKTWIAIATITVLSCVMNVHMFVGIIGSYYYPSIMAGPYGYFFLHVYHWLHGALFSVVPSVCQFICDIILSVTLIKAVSSASIATRVESNAGSAQNMDSRKNMSYRTTITVLVISITFLILTTPVFVYVNLLNYIGAVVGNHPRQKAVSNLITTLAYQLWYTNSAINFFLYCLTGTKFRREFINWISCGVKSSSAPPYVHETGAEASKK